MLRVGLIGLGNLGRPVARRLLGAGYELTVHNRSQAVVDQLCEEGSRRASSPREVLAHAEIVLTALPFPKTIEEVYFGPAGLALHAAPDQTVIDLSTVDPDTSRRIAAALARRGAGFLDAPVSGGPEAAERGSLAIMVGGDSTTFERARPILALLGSRVRLCGPSGAGSTMKLINQILITAHSAITAEALTFASQAGADLDLVYEMIDAGLAASAIFRRNGRRTIDRQFEPGARIDLMVKDAALVREQCDSFGLHLPVFLRARQSFEQALDLGYGHQDLAGVVHTLEEPAAIPAAPDPRPMAVASPG
jgi:3-hydroxyisobutyrate dehydrogenase-like beta-hydroxyacid dehydrogenase